MNVNELENSSHQMTCMHSELVDTILPTMFSSEVPSKIQNVLDMKTTLHFCVHLGRSAYGASYQIYCRHQ